MKVFIENISVRSNGDSWNEPIKFANIRGIIKRPKGAPIQDDGIQFELRNLTDFPDIDLEKYEMELEIRFKFIPKPDQNTIQFHL